MRKAIIMILITIVLCALCVLPACAEEPEYRSCDEMSGATVGLLTGMPFENMITPGKSDPCIPSRTAT